LSKENASFSNESPIKQSEVGFSVTATLLEQTKTLSKPRFFELAGIASKILLMTVVIFAAFFVPFFIGMHTSQLKNRTSAMKIEIQSMNTKIQEYNQKINAFGEMLLLKNRVQKSEVE
jgi:hypothetical protein